MRTCVMGCFFITQLHITQLHITPMNLLNLSQFEKEQSFYFKDKSLLQRAFVHRSYLNEIEGETELTDNERLEFLGDAILSSVVSEMLYLRFPTHQEGELTNFRAALVRRETLSRFAIQLHLGEYLLLGNGEEESGGRDRPATLCATFEAVVGAIYLDQGIEAVLNFAMPIVEVELARIQEHALEKDPKSRLQEWVQSTTGYTPRYKTVESVGPDHAKVFVIKVTIANHTVGVGQGRSKQEAAQLAAAMALYRLGQNAPEYDPSGEPIEEVTLSEITIEGLCAIRK